MSNIKEVFVVLTHIEDTMYMETDDGIVGVFTEREVANREAANFQKQVTDLGLLCSAYPLWFPLNSANSPEDFALVQEKLSVEEDENE